MKVDKSLKVCGVYEIYNKESFMSYIGSGKSIYKRISYHFSALRSNRHSNEHLQNAFNKYGEDAFEVRILETCELNKLHEREEYYISITPNKYNFNLKPTGPLKLPIPSAERREIVRQKLTGRKRTKEQCQRFSDSHIGYVTPEETKKKQSVARLNYIAENKDTILVQLSEAGKIAAKVSYEKFLLEHPDGHRVEWVTKICVQCGQEFKLQPHLAKIRQFCSNKCRSLSLKGKTPWNKGITKLPAQKEMICKNCGNQFISVKKSDKYSSFCGLSCRGQFNVMQKKVKSNAN